MIDKEVWDRVQELHLKKLILSLLGGQSRDDEKTALWNKMTEEIVYSGRPDTPCI